MKKILLISGHGAGQPGSVGNGYVEADLTRELVNLIAPKLENYAIVDVYDQDRNAYIDIENNNFNVSDYIYALEIHFNSVSSKQANGSEIYVTSKENGISVEQSIMKRLNKFFAIRDNDSIFDGVKKTDFLVIKTLKNKGINAALLETCFITNANDMNIYQKYKDDIALNIVLGIAEGFGLTKIENKEANDDEGVTKLYRVRKSWEEVSSQVGAFKDLNNAKAMADKYLGYEVYDSNGKVIYTSKSNSIKVGDRVQVIKKVDWNGTSLAVSGIYDVIQVSGDRVVIGKGRAVTAAIHKDNLKLV